MGFDSPGGGGGGGGGGGIEVIQTGTWDSSQSSSTSFYIGSPARSDKLLAVVVPTEQTASEPLQMAEQETPGASDQLAYALEWSGVRGEWRISLRRGSDISCTVRYTIYKLPDP